MWAPRRLTTLWASTACYREALPFLPTVPVYVWVKTSIRIASLRTHIQIRDLSNTKECYLPELDVQPEEVISYS
jgi:hypothetical protein